MNPDLKNISSKIEPVPSGIKRPLWSVMVPAFNPNEELFKEAINSVVSLNIDPDIMQIEVVDDCSTEVDVEKIVKENWNGRVLYHKLPKNVGHSFNFTECIRISTGEFVHLLHADDRVRPRFYEAMKNIFDKYENIGAAFCRQGYIDDDGEIMFYSELEMEEPGILDNALVRLSQRQRIQYCAMVVKRSTYEHVGGFMPKNISGEDWEMWVRIARDFQIGYEPQPLADYRIHRRSMTLNEMRTGQDMQSLREVAQIFTQYLPEEKRKEVASYRNKFYAEHSLRNVRRMYEEFNDEEGAAAQLTEAIKLNSEVVFESLDLLSQFKIPVAGAGVSVIINSHNDAELIGMTLKALAEQTVPDYIPWEIILADNSSTDNTTDIAFNLWKELKSNVPLRIIQLNNSTSFNARKTAIESSQYDFLLFCNPGNIPDPNYVKTVSDKMLGSIDTGAIGEFLRLHLRIKFTDGYLSGVIIYYRRESSLNIPVILHGKKELCGVQEWRSEKMHGDRSRRRISRQFLKTTIVNFPQKEPIRRYVLD